MSTTGLPLHLSLTEFTYQDYTRQYSEDFVSRWDELIDWDKRAAGEGRFFTDLLLKHGACTVLDVSTGSGFHAVQLSKAGFDVTACDGSPTMIERARANFVLHDVPVQFSCCDWLSLDPEVLGTFDAVICLGSSLCHVFDDRQRVEVLWRFRKMLKPGGLLLVDQRNFQAILDGNFRSSGRYYYCGKSAKVSVAEVNERFCEFVYTFDDGATYSLQVFPLRPQRLRQELTRAGMVAAKSYGDFKSLYDPARVDFIIHMAYAPDTPRFSSTRAGGYR